LGYFGLAARRRFAPASRAHSEKFSPNGRRDSLSNSPRPNSRWEPPVNVIETEDSLWVISAVPGVTAKDVKVELDGNELVISGTRAVPDCCRAGELKIWEIPLGQFERRLTVVDVEKTLSVGEVVLRNGLLLIELRKNS